MSKSCSNNTAAADQPKPGLRKCKAPVTYGEAYQARVGAKFIPMREGQPVLLQVPGVAVLYVPCFDSCVTLEKAARRLGFEHDDIFMCYGERFFEALEKVSRNEPVRAMLDPILRADGSVDFKELVLN